MNRGFLSGSYPSSSIRTGSRWTILTKLPVAFCGGSNAGVDPAFEYLSVAVHIDIQICSLTDAQVAQLRLLEIGIDPDLAERADRHQALSDLNIIARIDIPARDDAVNLRDNVTIAKVEFGQSEVALGGPEFSLGLLDRRRFRRQPIERAVDVALGIEFFEFFDHLLRSLVVRMNHAKLSRTLNQLSLRP